MCRFAMTAHVEAGYVSHLERLDIMEAKDPWGEQQKQHRRHRVMRRLEERQVLLTPLEDVLKKFPAFRKNFHDCDHLRREELTRWWKTSDPRLEPLLTACAEQGNFDVEVEETPQLQPSAAQLALASWTPFAK